MQPAGEIAYSDHIRIHPSRIVRTPTPLPSVQVAPGPGKSKTHADETNGGVSFTHTPPLYFPAQLLCLGPVGRTQTGSRNSGHIRPPTSYSSLRIGERLLSPAHCPPCTSVCGIQFRNPTAGHGFHAQPSSRATSSRLRRSASPHVPPRPPTSRVRWVASSLRFLRSMRRVKLAMQKKKSGEKGTRRASLGVSATPASLCSSGHGKTNSARSSFFLFLTFRLLQAPVIFKIGNLAHFPLARAYL